MRGNLPARRRSRTTPLRPRRAPAVQRMRRAEVLHLALVGPRATSRAGASAVLALGMVTPRGRRQSVAMRISAKVDYAVRAAVQLAAADGDRPTKGDAIAQAQGIPLKFLE